VSSFSANVDVSKVSQGMIKITEVLEHLSKAEKYMAIASVFNCMYNNKLAHERSVSDVMGIVDNMRTECKRHKIPEFGGAERFIEGEL
jgi:hypothetical protein